MTEVRIKENNKNGYTVKISGHSGDSFVCCAVSMLVQTVFCTFENTYGGRAKTELSDGLCTLDFDGNGADTGAAEVLIDVMRTGFEMLAKKYPKNIKIF